MKVRIEPNHYQERVRHSESRARCLFLTKKNRFRHAHGSRLRTKIKTGTEIGLGTRIVEVPPQALRGNIEKRRDRAIEVRRKQPAQLRCTLRQTSPWISCHLCPDRKPHHLHLQDPQHCGPVVVHPRLLFQSHHQFIRTPQPRCSRTWRPTTTTSWTTLLLRKPLLWPKRSHTLIPITVAHRKDQV